MSDAVGAIHLDVEIESMDAAIESAMSKIKSLDTGKMSSGFESAAQSTVKRIEEATMSVMRSMEQMVQAIMERLSAVKLPEISQSQFTAGGENWGAGISIPKMAAPRGPPTKINLGADAQLKQLEDQLMLIEQKWEMLDAATKRHFDTLEGLQAEYAELKQYSKAHGVPINNSSMENLAESIEKTASKAQRSNEALINLEHAGERVRAKMAELSAEIDNVGNEMENIPDVQGSPLGPWSGFLDGLKAKANQLGNSIKKGLNNQLNSFKNKLKDVGSQAQSVGTKGANAFGFFGRSIKQAAKRVLVMAVAYKAIRGLTSYISNAAMVNQGFVNSLNSIKLNLAAAFQPILNVVIPILNALASALATVTGYIAAFVSMLFGTTYSASVKGAKGLKAQTDALGGVGGAAGGAGKQVEKLKRALAGFDEINTLDIPEDSGGGGGGGAGGAGGWETGAEAVLGESNLFNKLKDSILAGDWQSLGVAIGEQINAAIDKIPWGVIGQKLGYGVNGAIQTIYYTLDTIDFKNIGSKISDFLNNALNEIDFTYLGRLLTKKVTMWLDTAIGAIDTLDWTLVGKSIGDYFRGALDEASEWVLKQDWGQIAKNIFKGISNAIKGIDFASLAKSFATLLGSAIGAGARFIWEGIKTLASGINNYFQQYITNDDGTKKTGEDLVLGWLEGIKDGLVNIGTWIVDNVWNPLKEAFKSAFGIQSPSTKMAELGKEIPAGLYKGIKEAISSGFQTIVGWKDKVVNWFKGTGTGSIVSKFKTAASDIVGGFKEKVGSTYSTVKSNISTWAEKTKEWFSGDDGVSKKTFGSYASDAVSSFKEKIGSSYETVKTNVTGWASSVKTWFSGTDGVNKTTFSGYGGDAVTGFKDKINSSYSNSKTSMTTWAASAKSWFSSNATGAQFATFAGNIVTGFKNKINTGYTQSKGQMTTWASSVKSWFTANGASSSAFYGVASDMIAGFKNGVSNLYYTTKSVVTSWASSVVNAFKSRIQIGSPSKLFADFGRWTVEGFNNSISRVGKTTRRVMDKWADSVAEVQPTITFEPDFLDDLVTLPEVEQPVLFNVGRSSTSAKISQEQEQNAIFKELLGVIRNMQSERSEASGDLNITLQMEDGTVLTKKVIKEYLKMAKQGGVPEFA